MPDRFDIPQLSSIPRPHDHDDESEAIANPFLFDDIVNFPPPESYPRLFRKDGAAAALKPVGIGDFGSANVRLKPFARAAFDGANVEHGLARAIGELHDLTESLIADPDFESHAETFERGVKTIADRVAERLPDGDATDSFRERFSLIAEGKAVELRGIDTRRLVARNRKGLDDTLASYAKLAGGAPNRLTSEFSVGQALRAIDREIDNGVISPDEARAIEAHFFRQIEDEAARQLIDLDPAHAADNLRDTSIYPQLDAVRRTELTELADRRLQQHSFDERIGRQRAEREAMAAKAESARAFVAGFGAKLRNGQAKATDIGTAESDGTIDRAEADRLLQLLRDGEARRAERARLGEVARIAIATGKPLDATNLEHLRAAEIHAADVVQPALIAAQSDDEILSVRALIVATGFLPPALGRLLGLMWTSGNSALGAKAARVMVGLDLEPFVPKPVDSNPGASNFPFRSGDGEPRAQNSPFPIPDAADAEAPDGFLLLERRPGMAEAVALMSAGLPADQAVPMGKEIAEKERDENDLSGDLQFAANSRKPRERALDFIVEGLKGLKGRSGPGNLRIGRLRGIVEKAANRAAAVAKQRLAKSGGKKVELDLSDFGFGIDSQDAIEGFVEATLDRSYSETGGEAVELNLGEVDPNTAERIEYETGIDVSGLQHSIDTGQINHTHGRHGIGNEESPDQIPVSPEAISVHLDVVNDFDRVTAIGPEKRGTTITFEKDIDGVVVVVEQTRTGQGKLSFFDMWIREQN